MKPPGCKFEHGKERDRDLMRAYNQLLAQKNFISLSDIYEEVVEMPSLRFWVSEERAAVVLASMDKGNRLTSMSKNKREMFRELYRRAKAVKHKFPFLTISEIAFKVVRQPAPKFYLTPGTAKVIICKAKKAWYEEKKRKLRHLF